MEEVKVTPTVDLLFLKVVSAEVDHAVRSQSFRNEHSETEVITASYVIDYFTRFKMNVVYRMNFMNATIRKMFRNARGQFIKLTAIDLVYDPSVEDFTLSVSGLFYVDRLADQMKPKAVLFVDDEGKSV